MQTRITAALLQTAQGREADRILRACVHCGFCTATCPTYQLLGDELDGPRGRIYLIKQMLEGGEVSQKTQSHLDRCLTCRSCETTCPSGVEYGRLVDIGRELVEKRVGRPLWTSIKRTVLRKMLPFPNRISPIIGLGRLFSPLLPGAVRQKIPARQSRSTRPASSHARRMLLLEGCVQRVVTPETSNATARVLDKLGIQVISAEGAGCCGAVSHHLAALHEGHAFIRQNIDAWWPHIEAGAEAIVIAASGCATMVKEYGHMMRDDPVYAEKAARVTRLAKDIGEILHEEPLPATRIEPGVRRVAFHSPCTLQHGQRLNGVVESVLRKVGFELTPVADAHLCCGSAGTYCILQPELSQQLLTNKLHALEAAAPEVIATANIGCQMHLSSRSRVKVRHWIELLDEVLS